MNRALEALPEVMYLWRKIAEPRWLSAHENILQALSGGRLAIISRPGRKRRQLQIACTSRNDSRKLVEEFGGRTEKIAAQLAQAIRRRGKEEAYQDWRAASDRQEQGAGTML